MKRGLFVPAFDNLADPILIAELAARAEEVGWDGFFLWDHIQYPDPIKSMCDPWICLAAIATRTERMRIGTMVTPLARRRPLVLARQAVSLDILSKGRMVLGLSVGGDWNGEMAELGEEGSMKERAAMLDEGLQLLDTTLRGEELDHQGTHYSAKAKPFTPTSVQTPRIPIWIGARWRDPFPEKTPKPFRRGAMWDGLFPDGIAASDVAGLRDRMNEFRPKGSEPLTLVARTRVEDDPEPWQQGGLDWLLTDLGPRQPDGGVRPMEPLETIRATIESLER